jgi:N-formylglutamate amidohydrolase
MVYDIIDPNPNSPILVSVPHCGTHIPKDIEDNYLPERITNIDDTDWYVDRLYGFVEGLGITMIKANISRWVIDLNRNPESKPLYDDGRVITALTPVTDFNGQPIYANNGPDNHEVKRRIETYFNPYYTKISNLLAEKRKHHAHVLFFDAHSIRRLVPGIRQEPFPDLILGDADQTSANAELIKTAESVLGNSRFTFQHNDPFKGGNLTRHFGKPSSGVHALQLEMSKVLYMDDSETVYDKKRAANVQAVLRPLFEQLLETLNTLNSRS